MMNIFLSLYDDMICDMWWYDMWWNVFVLYVLGILYIIFVHPFWTQCMVSMLYILLLFSNI